MRIYNSEGYEYTRDGTRTDREERISDFASAGVRFAVQTGRETELIVFFRARESVSGRSELFYGISQIMNRGDTLPIREFMRELQEKTEELGLQIDHDGANMEVFQQLEETEPVDVNAQYQLQVIDHLLSENQRLRFGVNDDSLAVGLTKTFISNSEASRVAICDINATHSGLQRYDLVFKLGATQELEPIEETSEKMERGKERLEESLLEETASDIKAQIRNLRDNTSLSDDDIRETVFQQVPTLRPPRDSGGDSSISGSSISHTGSGRQSSGGNKKRFLAKSFIGILGIVVIAVLVWYLGFSVGGIGGIIEFSNNSTSNSPDPTVTDLQASIDDGSIEEGNFTGRRIVVNGTVENRTPSTSNKVMIIIRPVNVNPEENKTIRTSIENSTFRGTADIGKTNSLRGHSQFNISVYYPPRNTNGTPDASTTVPDVPPPTPTSTPNSTSTPTPTPLSSPTPIQSPTPNLTSAPSPTLTQ